MSTSAGCVRQDYVHLFTAKSVWRRRSEAHRHEKRRALAELRWFGRRGQGLWVLYDVAFVIQNEHV